MTPHRMSSLPVARYCGLSPTLLNPSGRAAVISSAFHAKCADSPEAADLLALLHSKELAEVKTWKPPADVVVDGVLLKYAAAATEKEVRLPAGDDRPDIVGHLDMSWCLPIPESGLRCAFVADIKKSEWAAIGGLDSEQLHAYGLAECEERGADGYRLGIWLPVEGEWKWGDYIDALSSEYDAKLRLVRAAAFTPPEPNIGPHCSDCYSRLHCPAYTLPAHSAETWLEPLTKPGGITPDNALELLLKVQAVEKVVKLAKDALNEFADLEGIPDGKGKVYTYGWVKGKETSASASELRAVLGKDAEQFIKRGEPYKRRSWRKERVK